MPHKHAAILLTLIVAGVIGGSLCGWFFGAAMTHIAWLGTLFLNALKMLIVPLILASVISGVASLGDVRKLGRLGGATVIYFIASTGTAVLIGLTMVNLVQPGAGMALQGGVVPERVQGKEDIGVSDILLSMVSPNIIAAAANMDVLPLILFAILFAAALTMSGEAGQHVLRFFDGANEALMKMVIWVMYFAPVGIFALVAARLGQAGGEAFLEQLRGVGLYVVTVVSGLTLHFILLPAVLVSIGRRGIDFLVNMVGALFSAQAYGIELGTEHQVIVFITATLAAVGAAGIPEAGLVTMVIVLKAAGLPLEGIGLLLTVDWFLDRFRTAINVWGDAVGAAVIHRFLPKLL